MTSGAALRLDVLLVVVLGAVTGSGLALLLLVATGTRFGRTGGGHSIESALRRFGRRGAVAGAVAVAALVITRWPVAAVAAGGLVLAWPALFGGARYEKNAAAKVDALAVWTESLRDTIAGAVGLEQAVVATAQSPPGPIADEVRVLAERLRVRTPMPIALRRFADDLEDASADLIIATLILNARLRGPGLREVLTSLADSARSELEMRGRVASGRASTRRSVQIVVAVTVFFVAGLALFNREYVAPYSSVTGQGVLLAVVLLFAAGFFWLRQLSQFDEPGRLLTPSEPRP